MATIEFRVYDETGEIIERGTGKGSKDIDPITAQELCTFETVVPGREGVYMDMYVNGKLVSGCDL